MDNEYKKYTELDTNEATSSWQKWEEKRDFEALKKIGEILTPYSFDIMTTSLDDVDFEESIYLDDLKKMYNTYLHHRIDIHYIGLNIKRCQQLLKLAKILDYGTDVCMGGDEYCQTTNVNDKLKAYSYIAEAYDILKPYELDIQIDKATLSSEGSLWKHDYISDLDDICQTYHNDIEFIRDKLGLSYQNTEMNEHLQNNIERSIILPKELDTDEAKELFKRAINNGFMDENYKFIGTWYQAAYFAERASEYLNLKYKWKSFKELWNYDKLAQTRRESKERFGYVDRQNDIDILFP